MFQRVFKGCESMGALQYLTHFMLALRPDRQYCLALTEHRERRSLDANAYAWALMGKMAEALTGEAQGGAATGKDDVYLNMLRSYGQGGIVKVQNKDVALFKRTWKYHEEHERLHDENAAYFRFWVGSSEYTTKEMSLFIDGIVAECKGMDIETQTPQEIALMMERWKSEENNR